MIPGKLYRTSKKSKSLHKNPAAVLTALHPAVFAAAVGCSEPTTVHVRHRKRQAFRGVTKRNAHPAGRKQIAK